MTGGTRIEELRAPRDEDAEAQAVFVRAMSAEIGERDATSARDVLHEWSEPGFEREHHARVLVQDGRVIASAEVWHQDDKAWGGGAVLPEARGRGIGTRLLAWVVETARALPGVRTLYTGANVKRPDSLALIGSAGFTHVRTFFGMTHHDPAGVPPLTLPDGFTLDTSLRGDALVDALVEAHDGSFIDHWDFTPWRREDIAHWLEHPDADPEIFFVARGPDGGIAGLNLCWLDRGEGWIDGVVDVLGTTRPYRGMGVGSGLLRIGVRALAARGASRVLLGVDSENPTGALGLYERAGFVTERERRTFVLDVS